MRTSGSTLAYLIILGEVADEYRRRIAAAEEELSREMGTQVRLIVVDETRVAQLYIAADGARTGLEA